MASLTYSAQDEYGNDIIVRLPDWTGQPLLATTATPPDGTLVADGSEVSREVYHELFAKIGTLYGEGDGANTFNLPDWRDEFPRFSGAERAVGSKQSDAIRNITGDIQGLAAYGMSYQGAFVGQTGGRVFAFGEEGYAVTNMSFDASRVVPTADENRPRNVAFLPCIIYV